MEFSGISKKVNRYVYKALCSNPDGLPYDKIDLYAKYCNRNTNPVHNITEKIANSLRNYERYGIVRKTGDKYHLVYGDYRDEIIGRQEGSSKSEDPLDKSVPKNENAIDLCANDETVTCTDDEISSIEGIVGSSGDDISRSSDDEIAGSSNRAIASSSKKAIASSSKKAIAGNSKKAIAGNTKKTIASSSNSRKTRSLKRKMTKGFVVSDADDDEENALGQEKRMKRITLPDEGAEIEQGNSSKDDPKDVVATTSVPEANETKKLDDSADDPNNVTTSEEIIAPTTNAQDNVDNQNQFDNNAEREGDSTTELQTPFSTFSITKKS